MHSKSTIFKKKSIRTNDGQSQHNQVYVLAKAAYANALHFTKLKSSGKCILRRFFVYLKIKKGLRTRFVDQSVSSGGSHKNTTKKRVIKRRNLLFQKISGLFDWGCPFLSDEQKPGAAEMLHHINLAGLQNTRMKVTSLT